MTSTHVGARRKRRVARLGALLLAAVANLLMLSLAVIPGGGAFAPFAGPTIRPVEVSLAPLPVLRVKPGRASPAVIRESPTPTSQPAAPSSSTVASPPAPTPGVAIGSGPPGQAPGSAIGASLRRGLGCANQDAPWMSAADREACRGRLAVGAANAPYRNGIAAEKVAYYDALVRAQEDWTSGRNPGHPPFIFCGVKFGQGHSRYVIAPPHALKLGPCFIEPPQGALSITVDVPQPGDPQPDIVSAAGADPIRHTGQ